MKLLKMEGVVLVIGSQFGWIKANNHHNYMFDAKEYKYLINNGNYVKFNLITVKGNKKMAIDIERVRYIES